MSRTLSLSLSFWFEHLVFKVIQIAGVSSVFLTVMCGLLCLLFCLFVCFLLGFTNGLLWQCEEH